MQMAQYGQMNPSDEELDSIAARIMSNQEEVKKLMYNNRIEKILVVDSSGSLTGLVTMKDIEKSAEHPFATKDSRGQLRVGAALGTGEDTLERAKALSIAGVDLFVVDSAHGHSENVVETIKLIKKEFKDIDEHNKREIASDKFLPFLLDGLVRIPVYVLD